MEKYKLLNLQPVFETSGEHSNFFGYYNCNPLDEKGERLLAHRTLFDGRDLQPGDRAEVGYYTIADGQWHAIGETEAFNWQDGAMLQWIPGFSGQRLIYNVLVDGIARARLVDLAEGWERILERPIYAVHPSGTWAIGINFSRLSICRPSYGYNESRDQIDQWDGTVHPEDGLFRVNFSTGKSESFLLTKSVADHEPEHSAEYLQGKHYIQHPMWNPEGNRFILLHRYTTRNGSFKTRLFSASAKGDDLFHFPDAALFSHAAWRDAKSFTIWSVPGGGLMGAYAKHRKAGSRWIQPLRLCLRLGRKLFKGDRALQRVRRQGYYEMQDQSTEKAALAHGKITIDGHPTWFGGGKFMLTDTYQDDQEWRHLLLWDREKERVTFCGHFSSPFNNCGFRCDLHPRIDERGELVSLDSAHTGRRQLYLFRLEDSIQPV